MGASVHLAPAEADQLARLSIDTYNTLPAHGKPLLRANGVPEWTVLACIALRGPCSADLAEDSLSKTQLRAAHESDDLPPHAVRQRPADFTITSLASGAKVLPFVRLPPCGDTLHDSHAEVLVRRGFKRWLIDEATHVTRSPPTLRQGDQVGRSRTESSGQDGNEDNTHGEYAASEWMLWDHDKSVFRLRDGVEVWMYVSTLPCGDASTLYTAATQDPAMAALKSSSQAAAAIDPSPDHMGGAAMSSASVAARGRNGYTSFSQLRTKPGRTDSPPSVSHSCSDKLAAWSALGLGGALLDGIIQPVWLNGIVIGGVEDEPPAGWAGADAAEWKATVKAEVERALFGRLEDIQGRLPSPYDLHRPAVHFTSVPFDHHKTTIVAAHPAKADPVTSNTALLYLSIMARGTAGTRSPTSRPEVLTNGHKQGSSWRTPGISALPDRTRSKACKAELFRAYVALEAELDARGLQSRTTPGSIGSYHDIKHRQGSVYQAAKVILRGVPVQDAVKAEPFDALKGLAVSITPGTGFPRPPFTGWLVSGKSWESFVVDNGQIRLIEPPPA